MKIKKKLKILLNSKSNAKLIIILGLVGITLITISCIFPKKKTEKSKPAQNLNLIDKDTQSYVENLENKLNEIISQIDGVGKSKVMLTVEQGIENVYASAQIQPSPFNSNSGLTTSNIVVIDGNNGKQALVITQKQPKVKGVVVVCEGADDGVIMKRVNDAVTKSLNIKSNRVSVVKGIS